MHFMIIEMNYTYRKTAEEIQKRGGVAWAYQCDVSNKLVILHNYNKINLNKKNFQNPVTICRARNLE